MIGSLTGIVEEIFSDYIILNVNNIGYIVYLSAKSIECCQLGTCIKLYIETYVNRDNVMHLYGFITKDEQNCLRMLVKVNGVSYKTAMLILSKLSPREVFIAISSNNNLMLKTNGVGTKTIERIISELKTEISKMKLPSTIFNKEFEDSLSALVSLGYDKIKVFNVLKDIEEKFPKLLTQEIIYHALKVLT